MSKLKSNEEVEVIELEPFCWHAKIWLGFYGSTCPLNKDDCEGCGYYEDREPTQYFINKRHAITACQIEIDSVE